MFKISTNIAVFRKAWEKKQRAMIKVQAKAINMTSFGARKDLIEELPKKLDRPTPFTMRAFRVRPAKFIPNPYAYVMINPIQSEYLRYAIYGGMRMPKATAIPVPFNLKLNKYGNMPKKKIAGLLAKPDYFSGTIKGVPGVWQRMGPKKRKVRLAIGYEPKAEYRKIFPFFKIVRGSVRQRWHRNYARAFAELMGGRE